jgi:hypothetical protein
MSPDDAPWCHMEVHGLPGLITPPSSESDFGQTPARYSDTGISVSSSNGSKEVNTISPNTITTSILPASPPSPTRSITTSRRNRASVQKEADRSRQFTNRLRRSASESAGAGAAAPASTEPSGELLTGRKNRFQKRCTVSLPANHGLKAIEPLHEHVMTKMAFAEQQKWITVQQKTFTKWYNSDDDVQRGRTWGTCC